MFVVVMGVVGVWGGCGCVVFVVIYDVLMVVVVGGLV